MKIVADISKITPREKGYLVGFYIGDGNIFEQKSSGIYRLRYFLDPNEITIRQKIAEILSKMFTNVRIYDGQGNTIIIEVHSKQLLDWIKSICTKDGIKEKYKSIQFKLGVIEGLIDSDGYVQRNYLEITTSNKRLRESLIAMLEDLQINANSRTFISPLSKKRGWRIGFSLKKCAFKPLKWVYTPQTAENAA